MSGMAGMSSTWRHLRTDRSAVDNRINKGTVRRVLTFARPHRRLIAAFLVLTVIDAGLVVVSPLARPTGHRRGDSQQGHPTGALSRARDGRRGRVGAALAVAAGYLSSRIGEGLIFDLRTRVFAHVQRQSLAFFTRTQTGALVSRLNNDVIGAQRAFTSALSSTVSNIISVVVVGIAMLALSWQVTLACLALFPLLLLSSRMVSSQLAGLTREQMNSNADLGNAMTERFNVGGAMLLKLFGRSDHEDEVFAAKAGTDPRPRGPDLLDHATLRCLHDARPRARDRRCVRRRRSVGDSTATDGRHPGRARAPCCCDCWVRCRVSRTSGST